MRRNSRSGLRLYGSWKERDWLSVFTALFIILVFLTGGGSRADIASLLLLRPLAVVVCVFAALHIRPEHISKHRFIFGMASAIILSVLVQLIPMPPIIWQQLPGRELVVEIDRVTGLNDIWRPLSVTPGETWNALYSLFVPMATVLLLARMEPNQRQGLLPIILAIAAISGLWGIVQIVGGPKSWAYFYDVTNNGAAVGLFANRNHQAVFLACIFPMLAVYASAKANSDQSYKMRQVACLSFGALLVPLLLVTGSRAGLVLGVVGLGSIFLLYRKPKNLPEAKRRGSRMIDWRVPAVGILVVMLAALTVILSRAESLRRLVEQDTAEDLRSRSLDIVWKLTTDVFPAGSGYGSFPQLFIAAEPDALLSQFYFNHAHNDWIEVVMNGGIVAMIILIVAIIAFARQSIRIFRKEAQRHDAMFGRLAAVIIAILAAASLADYPLRVPSLATLFVIAAFWLHDGEKNTNKMVASNGALG